MSSLLKISSTLLSLSLSISNVFGQDVSCTESITVTDVQLSGSTADFSGYVGTYYYSGQMVDDDGFLTPRYVDPVSKAEFNIAFQTRDVAPEAPEEGYYAVSFRVPDGFTNPEDGFVWPEFRWISTRYFGGEIQDIVDNGCTTVYTILDGSDAGLIQCGCNPIFNGDSSIDPYDWFFADPDSAAQNGLGGYYQVRIIATFDDCASVGISRAPLVTPSPTLPDGCPDYSADTYTNGCAEDDGCMNSCQPWGCQGCDDGYFRLGWNQFCQPCSIINNCNTCADYQGCTSCSWGTQTWGACDGFSGAICA